MHLWKTFAALGAVGLTAAIMPTATASKPPLPTAPTKGACAFTPMTDPTYSTFVGLPPDPAKATTTGKASITLKTNQGDIPLVLDRSAAPCAVRSMIYLAHQKYYDGTKCHRLTAYHTPPYALSVLQCGDPLGTGWGDPGYWFKDELGSANALPNWPGFPDGSRKNYPRGTLAMANGGPDTNGSQFFLVYADSRLTPDYTVFGHITAKGMDVLDHIAAGGVDPGTDGTPEDGAPALTTIIERAKSGA
jgi:Peptidyl-prolyl cis-trans isomerase (rotamase) - cyclophilin family